MKNALAFAVLLLAASAWGNTSRTAPSTTNNDDSCDIAVQPAATLLLPYFEVDLKNQATTTLFTIQNISPQPQVANVTIWTDWSFPALSFSVHLTGYDVQGINLSDVFTRGAIPATRCTGGAELPASLVADLESIFTTGRAGGSGIACTTQVGGVHTSAVGYATIDVVTTCAISDFGSGAWFANLLYDNVLTGDYQQLMTGNGKPYASGGPLVHIRAIPEGGRGATTALLHTFYESYVPGAIPAADRRQPLPSAFAPRAINSGAFTTTLKIWRESVTTGACSGAQAAKSNSNVPFIETVRFDEHENATIANSFCGVTTCPPFAPGIPSTSALSSTNTSIFPSFSTSGDVAGWLYVSLPTQGWITVSMFADPSYATEATAAALGNGCSPAVKRGAQIGPAPNVTP